MMRAIGLALILVGCDVPCKTRVPDPSAVNQCYHDAEVRVVDGAALCVCIERAAQ